MNADPYDTLARALRERLEAIADQDARTRDPAAHLQHLQTASENIDAAAAALPKDADPRLRHFIEQCSYSKALAFIDALQR